MWDLNLWPTAMLDGNIPFLHWTNLIYFPGRFPFILMLSRMMTSMQYISVYILIHFFNASYAIKTIWKQVHQGFPYASHDPIIIKLMRGTILTLMRVYVHDLNTATKSDIKAYKSKIQCVGKMYCISFYSNIMTWWMWWHGLFDIFQILTPSLNVNIYNMITCIFICNSML